MKFKGYLQQLAEKAIRIDEIFNRNMIIKSSNYIINNLKAEYEWIFGDHIFYLFAREEEKNVYSFLFTDHELKMNRTKRLEGQSASSVLSGAILAIKEFLSKHPNAIAFSYEVDKIDHLRRRLYTRGIPLIEKECNAKFLEEEESENYVRFIFKII